MNRVVTFTLSLLICFGTASAQQRPIDEDFLDAVQKKDIPKINLLLSQGANVNARSSINGYFALQYAINWPDINLVKLLFDKGANVDIADDSGNTALIDAADEHGPEYTAIVKLLLEHGANVHAHADAAIFGAAREADPEVVRLLLAKGAPVNAREKDQDNNTVLMEATSGGSLETVAMLLAAGADVKATNDKGETALMKAVKIDHRYSPQQRLPMIELLLTKGADVNAADKSGRTPLLHSVVQYMSEAGGVISHPEVVKLLLERGANVQASDKNGDTALTLTTGVYEGPIDIVRYLLGKGINVNAQNKKGTTALMLAASKGKTAVVELLLASGADLNLKDGEGATALDYAVDSGQTELAKSLFKSSARSKHDYKSEDEMVRSVTNAALLEAAERNKLDGVKSQLAAGADVNTRSRSGNTALMLAIEYSYGRLDVATFLIDNGADLNAVDNDGNTALMNAISRNNNEAVVALLAHKAAVHFRNKEGRTALHIAAAEVHQRDVEALLAIKPAVMASSAGVDLVGVDVNSRDNSGRTPLMLAADHDSLVPDDVMELLLAHGAKIDERDPQGNTSLMIAAKAGGMSGVEYLVSKGAAVNLKNNAGETALKFARKIHENERVSNAKLVEDRVVAMLLRAGAKE
jgi:serine/threonine-protein phosphatase 6 regulatory ankyrin repeat subunit A/serine/threonine-protein phosphatase 6 regulatory ankyrin repeat subunit B